MRASAGLARNLPCCINNFLNAPICLSELPDIGFSILLLRIPSYATVFPDGEALRVPGWIICRDGKRLLTHWIYDINLVEIARIVLDPDWHAAAWQAPFLGSLVGVIVGSLVGTIGRLL